MIWRGSAAPGWLRDVCAWSPLQYGFFRGHFVGCPEYDALNRKLEELASAYGVTAGKDPALRNLGNAAAERCFFGAVLV